MTVGSPVSAGAIAVDFEHWNCPLSDDLLARYGSPHFDEARARNELCDRALSVASLKTGPLGLAMSRMQVIAANEAFPEAAVSDPIADLELWEEWNSGIRTFPYPGRYSRLGLTTQEGKVSASSSVGVVGEIMAGLFAQQFISPFVLVRVVRRWPDFIFHIPHENGRYAFVEAKAFTTQPEGWHALLDRIHAPLLGECARQAVQQLNADPFVKVWGAFTHVAKISPMQLRVTFVEFDCPSSRREALSKRVLPQALIAGLASRAIAQAAGKFPPARLLDLRAKPGKRSGDRQRLESMLVNGAHVELEELLVTAGLPTAVNSSRGDLDAEIKLQVARADYPEQEEGRRFFAARESASRGEFAPVRQLGRHTIVMGDLASEQREELERTWVPDWSRVGETVRVRDVVGWRCGGAVFAVLEQGA